MRGAVSCIHFALLLALLCGAQRALGQDPLWELSSPYLEAELDPTGPTFNLLFVGYSSAQWYAQLNMLWLEERLPDGTAYLRLSFPTDSTVDQFTTLSADNVISNLVTLSLFENNATVTTLGQYFANATNIIYPAGSIALVPQSFKISFNVSNWSFASPKNSLALGFSGSTSVSVFEMGGDTYPNGQLRSASIQGIFDWVKLDLFNFAITPNSTGGFSYPPVDIHVMKSGAFPPSATAEIVFPYFQDWIDFDPTIQLVVAAPDRPQLLLLIVGILAAVLVCIVFGALLAFACRYYRSISDVDHRSINSESTRLINH